VEDQLDEYQLGWQDPIDQLDALRVAVKHLRAIALGPRERFDRATSFLTKYWRMPDRLKHLGSLTQALHSQKAHSRRPHIRPEIVEISRPRSRSRRRKSNSQRTRCWSKRDSNYQSHRERSGHGRARTNQGHHARSRLIRPPSLFGNTWDQEFESPLLQQPVCLSSEP
jgi:hypothetical protein